MVHCWWQYTGEPWLCVSRIFLQCHISRYLYCLLWGQQILSANPSPKIKVLHDTNDGKVSDTWLRNHEFSSVIRVIIYSFLLLSLLVPNVTGSWPEDQIWFADKHPHTHFQSCIVLNVFSCQHLKNQDLSHTKIQFPAFLDNSAGLETLVLISTWQREAVGMCIFKLCFTTAPTQPTVLIYISFLIPLIALYLLLHIF